MWNSSTGEQALACNKPTANNFLRVHLPARRASSAKALAAAGTTMAGECLSVVDYLFSAGIKPAALELSDSPAGSALNPAPRPGLRVCTVM